MTRLVARHPGVAVVVALGFASELTASLRHAWRHDLGWPSMLWMAAYLWLAWGALAWLVGYLRALPRSTHAWWRRRSVLIAAIGVSLFHLVSWSVRVTTGRFLDLEAMRLAWVNPRMLGLHLLQTEAWRLGGLAAAVAAVLAGWTLVARGAGRADEVGWRLWRRRSWLGAAALAPISVGLASGALPGIHALEGGASRSEMRWQFSPLPAFLASAFRPIESDPGCLDHASLVPLGASDWRPRSTLSEPPSVLFVAVESLRHDLVGARHQGREITPTLNALAAGGLHFTRAYAQSTHSDYSDPSVLSALYPLRSVRHHYYSASDPWPKTLVYDLLKEAGHATALFSAQNESWGGMDKFLQTPGLDLLVDARRAAALGAPTLVPEMDDGFAEAFRTGAVRAGKLDDRVPTRLAVKWIAEQVQASKPFFAGLNYQSSHFPYVLPAEAPRPFAPHVIDFAASFSHYPKDKVETVRNAYFNSIQWIDAQLLSVLEALESLGVRDRVLVVVYGENGEMFHEHGMVTHAKDPFEPAIRVPVVVAGGHGLGPRRVDEPVQLVDVVPTVLALAGFSPLHPNFQGRDFFSLEHPEERPSFFHNQVSWSEADGVILGRWKYWHDRQAGAHRLYDLETDPAERRNLASQLPERTAALHNLVRTWRCRQLTYYGSPLHYTRYHPPPPPEPGDAFKAQGRRKGVEGPR